MDREHSQFEAHLEVDEVVKELNRELKSLIDGKLGGDRKGFRLKKKHVVKLLRELMKDVEGLPFRG